MFWMDLYWHLETLIFGECDTTTKDWYGYGTCLGSGKQLCFF